VVYVSQQRAETRVEEVSFPTLIDPAVIRAARQIYRTYYEVHPEINQRPLGVAIDRYTHRGKLIFTGRPVLLPQECFVPFNQIESDLY
jgi:hypothetical protein